YADFDRKDATSDEQIGRAISQISLQLGVEPISVVDSGGGLHPRWKLAKPVEPEDSKGVLSRWQATVQRIAEENGFKADSVFDLPRVLRLPGTVNEKYDDRPAVTITARDTSATVPTAAVWSKLDQHKSKLSHKKTAPKPEQVDSLNLDDAVTTPPPAKPEQSGGVMSERYVNSEMTRATAPPRLLTYCTGVVKARPAQAEAEPQEDGPEPGAARLAQPRRRCHDPAAGQAGAVGRRYARAVRQLGADQGHRPTPPARDRRIQR